MEFRAFDHIYTENQLNPKILQEFGSIRNYFMSFIRDIVMFIKTIIDVYNKQVGTWIDGSTEPIIVYDPLKFYFGMEIETCMDCNKN